VERGVVGVDRRGALLGPEESGRPERVGPVFLGHEALFVEAILADRFRRWGGVAGAGCQLMLVVVGASRGVFSLGRGGRCGCVAGLWPVFLPVF
jgi:hypothetical protein